MRVVKGNYTIMVKKQLAGTLEEQCDFLYQLAQEKMTGGNYVGAVYALKEIVKYQPDYADAARLLAVARQQKKKQTFRIVLSLVGAILAVGVGSAVGLSNDLLLLALACAGLLLGYAASNLVRGSGEP